MGIKVKKKKKKSFHFLSYYKPNKGKKNSFSPFFFPPLFISKHTQEI